MLVEGSRMGSGEVGGTGLVVASHALHCDLGRPFLWASALQGDCIMAGREEEQGAISCDKGAQQVLASAISPPPPPWLYVLKS